MIAHDAGATHLGIHWIKGSRNEAAAAFFASLPGVVFAPMRDHRCLGLAPLECEREAVKPVVAVEEEVMEEEEEAAMVDAPPALALTVPTLSIRVVLWAPKEVSIR